MEGHPCCRAAQSWPGDNRVSTNRIVHQGFSPLGDAAPTLQCRGPLTAAGVRAVFATRTNE